MVEIFLGNFVVDGKGIWEMGFFNMKIESMFRIEEFEISL